VSTHAQDFVASMPFAMFITTFLDVIAYKDMKATPLLNAKGFLLNQVCPFDNIL
jgi:hypothetical protein